MTRPTYARYRDSGVAWLGDVPESWPVMPVRRRFNITIGKMLNAGAASGEGEIVPYLRAGNVQPHGLDLTEIKHIKLTAAERSSLDLRKGDLVVVEGGAGYGRSAFLDEDLTGWGFQNHILRVRPTAGDSGKFLNYLVKTLNSVGHIPALSDHATIPSLSSDQLGRIPIPIPDTTTQRTVVKFLDRETAKIDALIVKQEQLIATLREDRTATITHAVTKGLNPDVKMKDSGVTWLRSIPSHWQVMQSRRLFRVRKERALGVDIQLTASQKYGVIPQQDFMELEGSKVTQVILNPEILKHVDAGDFVISMRSFQGGIEFSPYSGCVSSAYVPLIPGAHIDAGYFKYVFKSKTYIQALQSTSNLVRDGQALRFENFSMVPLPLVPVDEQRAIADYLDARCNQIDALMAKADQVIDTLREYRSALITDAVTGKIDVRGAA